MVIKEESPAGFKFIAEPEFRAKDIVRSGNEILSAVAVPLRAGGRARAVLWVVGLADTLPPGKMERAARELLAAAGKLA